MPTESRCANCRFWLDFEECALGECRRRAPRPVLHIPRDRSDRAIFFAFWPETSGTDWCGEWAPLPLHQEEVPR